MTLFRVQEAVLKRELEIGRGGSEVLPFPVHIEPRFSLFRHPQPGKTSSTQPPPFTKVNVPPLSALSFLDVKLSLDDTYNSDTREQLPLALGTGYPVAFEVIGIGGKAILQFVATKPDAPNVISQLQSHYPEAQVIEVPDPLSLHKTSFAVARSYCLRDSHLFQIRSEHRPESYTALVGILANLREGEAGLFQVLFYRARHPWHENIMSVATDRWDPSKSSFVDLPDLPRKARGKIEKPLFAVALRMAASDPDVLARLERSFLSQFESVENGLKAALSPYPLQAIVGRYPQAPGMLLNLHELAALVHLPDPDSIPEGLDLAESGAHAPDYVTQDILVPLGLNQYRGEEIPVGISEEQLTRHVAIFGGTGYGKTNLMKVAFKSLLEKGYGMAVIDPKGDLAQGFLRLVPKHRIDDVVWFDPTDREYPPALNVLEASEELQNEDLTAELMVGLKRLYRGASEFGPRMEWILRNAVRSLLDSQGEKTLYDIPRFLQDPSYKQAVLASVKDPQLRNFWEDRGLNRSVTDPIVSRLATFLDRPTIKNVVSQPNRIDLHQIMREKKIFIANLERGQLQDAAFIIGSFVLSRLQLAAQARRPEERSLFPIIVDEFHNFAGHGMDTESIQTFLGETRSYRAPLVVATQYLGRLNRDVVAAIFGTVGTVVCMHLGQIDAQAMQRELGDFTAEDLLDLDIGEAIVRVGVARDAFNIKIPLWQQGESHHEAIITRSRERYCRPVSEVEKLLNQQPEPESPGERLWIADAQGNVFTQDDLKHGVVPTSRPQPQVTGAEPVAEPAPTLTHETIPPDGRQETPVHKELIEYLEHAAMHPFMPVASRNEALSLSKYRSLNVRKQLEQADWIRQHKVSSGRRAGQLILVEVTEPGYEFLASMKIRVQKPRGRGGFIHKYFAHRLKEYAEATWQGCTANIEDDSRGRPADVVLRTPEGRNIAFEVFVTGEDKEVKGIVQDAQLFDEVIVCAEDSGSLESLKARAFRILDAEMLSKVSFSLIAPYLAAKTEGADRETTSERPSQQSRPKSQTLSPPSSAKSDDQVLIPPSDLEKSAAKLELEPEPRKFPGKRRRKFRTPLTKQIEEAYTRLHDLDWLRDSDLTTLPGVQERVNPVQVMPEAQALREVLLEAARQVLKDVSDVPELANVHYFLEEYLKGKSVAQIAKDLGVTRSWCSRAYRKEAFEFAGTQFAKVVSMEIS